MIPANKTTLPQDAYALAIEKAEEMAKHYHRLAFWLPFVSKNNLIMAKLWEWKVAQLKRHAQYLGAGVKNQQLIAKPSITHIQDLKDAKMPPMVDVCLPPRPSMADNVGFGE